MVCIRPATVDDLMQVRLSRLCARDAQGPTSVLRAGTQTALPLFTPPCLLLADAAVQPALVSRQAPAERGWRDSVLGAPALTSGAVTDSLLPCLCCRAAYQRTTR